MRQLPIIFNGPMVRAILEGRKSETRRPMKHQPDDRGLRFCNPKTGWEDWHGRPILSPFGQLGDLLYVRETWAFIHQGEDSQYVYRATDPDWATFEDWKWSPSIHMRKEAARIWLQNKGVSPERIQDINEDGIKAEGLACLTKDGGQTWKWGLPDRNGLPGGAGWPWDQWETNPREAFRKLWESVYPDSWDRNDWVFATKFDRINAPGAAPGEK